MIACIEDQEVIDSILAHLRNKEQDTPTLPHLGNGQESIKEGYLLATNDFVGCVKL